MKGKTKTILTVIIAILVFATAVVGTVTFLKDDGEASAAEEGVGNVLPVTGSDDEQTTNPDGEENPAEDLEGVENPEEQPAEGTGNPDEEGTTGEGETTGTTGAGTQGTGTGELLEPEPTTIEQERLVSTTLNWSSISLNSTIGDTGINYTDLAYTIKYYQVVSEDEINLLNTETGKAKYASTVTVTEEQIKENCPEVGYKFDETSELSVVITENIETNLIEVYYIKDRFDLKIDYVYEDGTPAADPHEKDYEYEEDYRVESPEIEGYTPDKEVVEGTMPGEDTTITVTYKPNTDTKYKVEHYLENLAGDGYSLQETENKTGTTDTEVTATAKEFEGFTFDNTVEETVETGIIAGDGSLVLKLYYTRNSYKVTYEYTGTVPTGASELPVEATYKYEEAVEVAAGATAPGYTFNGWDKENFTMPAEDVVIKGSFTANENTAYKVEHYLEDLDGNGYTLKDTENKAGTTDTEVTATAKTFEGFTFDNTVEGTVETGIVAGDGSLVLKLYYTRNSYKVTYVYEGKVPTDATELPAEATYEYGAEVTVAEDGAATGYTFSGWDKEDFTMPAEDVVIKGQFDINSYKVIYVYEGTVPTDATALPTEATYEYGAEVTVEEDATATGYTFSGWDKEDFTMPAQDVVIKGSFTANENTAYKIEHYLENLDGNGYTLKDTENKTGTTDTEVTAIAKTYEGFTFDSTVEETVQKGIVAGDGSLVLKLYYTRNSYKVTYVYEGTVPTDATELPAEATYKYGAQVTVAANATAEGYTFSGWDKTDFTMPANDVVIKGHFDINSYKVTYVYEGTVPAGASTLPAEATYKYGAQVTVAANATAEGYTFSGWDKVDFTMPAQDVVIKGSFTANENTAYKVEHYLENLDGEGYTLKDTENKTGTTDTEVTATAKIYEGFTFDSTVEETVQKGIVAGDGSLVLKLYYTRNSYKVTYEYTGTVPTGASTLPAEATYKYGAQVTVAANATATGYTFSGWDKVDFTMPAEDVVIKGSFTINKYEYRIEYYYQGVLDDSKTENGMVDYGTIIDEYTDKKIDGYVFEKVENKPLTISANKEENVIKVYYVKGEFGYSIEYYYDGIIDSTKTETDTAVFGSEINGYTDNLKTGYKLENVINNPLTITSTVADNVMKVYYVKDSFEYTIEYYYDGVIDNSKTVTEKALFESKITSVDTETNKTAGYEVEKIEGLTLTITADATDNVIKVYYSKPDISIAKEGPTTAPNVGDIITYTITLTNNGKVKGTTTVKDTLPEGLTFVSADNGGTHDDGVVTWSNVEVPANGTKILTVTVTVNANKVGATITNTASFSEDTPTTSGTTTDTATTEANEITAIVKEGKDSVNVILVIDLSYSMKSNTLLNGKTRLEAAKTAAVNFINNLYKDGKNPNATVTVITFNTATPNTRTVTGYVGTTVCDGGIWHDHYWGGCKQIDGVWYKEWETVTTTETVPYSGTSQLGTTVTSSNYSTLTSAINAITLPDTNPDNDEGYSYNGLGTNVRVALDLTLTTIPTLNSENSNAVIFLSDGKPSTSYTGNSIDDLVGEDGNGGVAAEVRKLADIYSIGFGSEAADPDETAYELLYDMSSNNYVYSSEDETKLNTDFNAILGEIEPQTPTTVDGVVEVTLTNALDTTKPITILYGESETTIYTCSDLSNDPYITYNSTTKKLTFDINAWNSVEANTKILSEQVIIMCHVES